VRRALEGGGRDGEGAIAVFLAAVAADERLREAVSEMAAKKQAERRSDKVLTWFRGWDTKPDMIVPLAMLLVLDELADAKREVKMADVLAHWPRSLVTPCLRLLKAHGMAASEGGHTIKIYRTPAPHEAP
jgi:hypothetical protein